MVAWLTTGEGLYSGGRVVARWSDGMVYQAGGQAVPEAMQSSCPGPSFGFWPTENTEVVDALKHKWA